MAYLLDANVFIQAKNEYYGMDFCPGFWDWLDGSNQAGVVASVAIVGEELTAGHDQLAQWSASRENEFFIQPDDSVFAAMAQIGAWIDGQRFTSPAVEEFIGSADHTLVGHALSKKMTVVTHEKPSTSLKKVKIPDVCDEFRVACITPFEMLRVENARLVLG